MKETPKPTCWAQHLVRGALGTVLTYTAQGLVLLQVGGPSLYSKEPVGFSDTEGRMDECTHRAVLL